MSWFLKGRKAGRIIKTLFKELLEAHKRISRISLVLTIGIRATQLIE
jgi:hypothetical protein